MANDKWSMFKQYMHNELGISKDDIRQWIKEAIQEEAKQLIQQTGFDPKDAVREQVKRIVADSWGNGLVRDVKELAGKAIADQLDVTVSKKS